MSDLVFCFSGLKFANLCELARHLVDKSCVDGGSGAALLLADTLAGNYHTYNYVIAFNFFIARFF